MMKTRLVRVLAVTAGVAVCGFAAPASAATPPPYAGFDIGFASIGLPASAIEEPGLVATGSDRRDTGFAISLGWRFSPVLAAEASFIELGEARYPVNVDDGGTVSNASVTVRSTGVLLAMAGTWPIHERLSLEGRAGTYLGKTETRARGQAFNPLGSQRFNNLVGSSTKAGLAAGVGAVAAFNDTWGLRVGYDYLDKAFGEDAGRFSVGVRFNWP